MDLSWLQFGLIDWFSMLVFLLCWVGYTRFAIKRSRTRPALATALDVLRKRWMLNAVSIYRAETARDILSVGMFERSVAFFASTSIFIIAGLLTVLGNSETVFRVFSSVHFASESSVTQIQVKTILLVFIFVHAFFKFCWAMRCYSFLTTMLGAVPLPIDKEQNLVVKELTPELESWAQRSANIMSTAAHHFNLGLRAYYFALAVLAWFIHPVLFILANLFVVGVLYRRDFKSYMLKNLTDS